MLALCLMLSVTYYAQNYAGIVGWSLARTHKYNALSKFMYIVCLQALMNVGYAHTI